MTMSDKWVRQQQPVPYCSFIPQTLYSICPRLWALCVCLACIRDLQAGAKFEQMSGNWICFFAFTWSLPLPPLSPADNVLSGGISIARNEAQSPSLLPGGHECMPDRHKALKAADRWRKVFGGWRNFVFSTTFANTKNGPPQHNMCVGLFLLSCLICGIAMFDISKARLKQTSILFIGF